MSEVQPKKDNKPVKPKQSPSQGYRLYAQYVLMGAALGLYYGIFYRESTYAPDFLAITILSALAAVVATVVRGLKNRKEAKAWVGEFAQSFLMFFLFLGALQSRSIVYEKFGKIPMIIFTTVVGALAGFILGLRKKPMPPAKN
ncbi:MAG: hypothetical protein ACOYKD_09300 [Anaerolineaceae bacterium]|jgi:hypothetical protein